MAERLRRLGGLIVLAAVAGCSFAPPYHPPTISTPAVFKEAGDWVPASAAGDIRPDWWTMFGDPTLNRLETQVAAANPTLAGALARYDVARAYLTQARSSLFPTLGVQGDFERERQSDNRPLRSANQPDYYSADTIEASLGYEVDLWGRVRNAVAAGRAEAEASGDDLAAIRLSLEADTAASYMTLRGYDRQAQLLSATVDAFAQANHVIDRRFSDGVASGIETSRSGAQLADARAQLADVGAARALTEHALASLTGTPASSFAVPPAATGFALPPVPAALPSQVLLQRPDIAAAERRVAAANAEIGVAKAAFFPAIRLGAAAGFQNTGLDGLVAAPNTLWSIGPNALLTIFDGGRRRAGLAAARARWAGATADYRERALAAFQQVEDSLAELHHLGDEAATESEAVRQAAVTERLTTHRYKEGAVSYLELFTAQTTALRVRRTALDLETRRLQASIALIRALGGGWQPTQPPTQTASR